MTYPTLSGEAELTKIKTKDDAIRELKNKTERHDYENNLKILTTTRMITKKSL